MWPGMAPRNFMAELEKAEFRRRDKCFLQELRNAKKWEKLDFARNDKCEKNILAMR